MRHLKYRCTSEEDQILMYSLIDSLGLPIYGREEALKGEYFKEYPYIGWEEEEFVGWTEEKEDVSSSRREFIKYLSEFELPIIVGLTEDYDAVIKTEGIRVGCQLVTWEKYEELQKAVEKFRNKDT